MKRKGPRKPGRDDYLIGFGRPPKATQFKKGTSGNKKGRPKGAKNIATLFRQEMNQRIIVSENGERRTITKIEAALKQLHNKAATGDPKSIQAILSISRELGYLIPDPLQEPQVRRFELRVFDKDLETGKLIRVKPMTQEPYDDDEDDE